MGYTESGKREELFDHSGRMILLRRTTSSEKVEEEGGVDMPGRLPDIKGKGRDLDMEGEVVGYVSFRFDTEETLGPRDAEVIYWYVPQLFCHSSTTSRSRLDIQRMREVY